MALPEGLTEQNYLRFMTRLMTKSAENIATMASTSTHENAVIVETAQDLFVKTFRKKLGSRDERLNEILDEIFEPRAQAVGDVIEAVTNTWLKYNHTAPPKELIHSVVYELIIAQNQSFESWGDELYAHYFGDDADEEDEEEDDDYEDESDE